MTILLVVLIAALVAADQLVKHWAVTSLKPVGSMDFIRFGDFELFDLTYLENDGAIFGSMSGQRWFLIGFTMLIIVLGCVGMFWALKRSKFLAFSIMLFVAGGIGNFIDRISSGLVIDMICIPWFSTFNVADLFITFGAIILVVYILVKDKALLADEPKKKPEAGHDADAR